MLDEIETIVLVMLENRSFDNVLGHLSHPRFGGRDDVDGLRDPESTHLYDNFYESRVYKPFPATDGPFRHDLPHDRATIAQQLDVVNGQATMGGFVRSYVERTRSRVKRPPPMGFLKPKGAPISGFLAAEHTVCDRWFSPLPTGTQPNRAMAFTGSSLLEDNVTGLIPHEEMVFDWLEERGVRWRVYHHGISFFLLFGMFGWLTGDRFRSIRELARDVLDEPADRAPQVIVIEPEYEDSPTHLGFLPNDNHPPLPLAPGEALLHSVYTALTRSPARWRRTLLVVTYDEHGGFFDHVEPPEIRLDPPPGAKFEAPFLRAGVRVPALVASPFAPRGGVCSARLDHTSLLQLLAERFAGGPDRYSPAVTERRHQGIESLSRVLTLDAPRSDVPAPPTAPLAARTRVRGGAKRPESENQEAFAEAARACLRADRARALATFPELALLPEAG